MRQFQPSGEDVRRLAAAGTVLSYRDVREDRSSKALFDVLIAVVSAMGAVCWMAFGAVSILAIFIAKTPMNRLYVSISCVVLLPLSFTLARALLRESRLRWQRVL